MTAGTRRVAGRSEASKTPIVAVAGRKGGSGKTTTTLNLAGALAERGQRILLVDLDPQASLTRLILGDEASESRDGIGARILAPHHGLADLAQQVFDGIDLFPGDRGVETAAFTLVDDPTGPLRLRKLLAGVSGYDLVLLDTPPALGFAVNSALLAAQVALLPTMLVQQDFDALADTLVLRDRLEELGAAQQIIIVPNAYRHDGNDRRSIAALTEGYGGVVSAPIPLTVSIKYALNERRPVGLFEPRGPAAAAYRGLADRLLQEVHRA